MYISEIRRNRIQGRERIECDIYVEKTDERHFVWLEIAEEYGKYLCTERADAFVILLLPLAMSLNENIMSTVPVTEDVLYGLERDMIPILAKYSEGFYQIKVIAEGKEALQNVGHVGVGCSCGVDSLYAIKTNMDTGFKNFDITDLCLFNNLVWTERNRRIFASQIVKTKKVAEELGLPLVICDSNCMEMLPVPEDYNFLNTYAILFFVFSLQKLFGRYYLGSNADGYSIFTVKDADKNDCSYYDLLTLYCVSTKKLKILSACGAVLRNEKIEGIAEWNIAQKYLKVCNESEENCGRCGKCKRTLMSIEALGRVDEFKNVFDTTYFKSNRKEYYYWLYKRQCMGDDLNKLNYEKLKESSLMKEAIADDRIFRGGEFFMHVGYMMMGGCRRRYI